MKESNKKSSQIGQRAYLMMNQHNNLPKAERKERIKVKKERENEVTQFIELREDRNKDGPFDPTHIR